MIFKRFILVLAALLCLNALTFADVVVKDIGGGEVELTFTFRNDAATKMGLIGSFNNWTEPGVAMAKNADGKWELTIKAKSDDEIVYKFFYEGQYIFDERAPDKKDDGFGGSNGLVIVADLLAGGGASGTATAATGAVASNVRPKVAFGTSTFIESDTTFDTDDGAFAVVTSSLVGKSTWTFAGDLIANMPGKFELTFFDGKQDIFREGPVNYLDLATGLNQAASGILFRPAHYLSGNERPTLDAFKVGVDSGFVNFETGYGKTPRPSRTSVLWEVVSDDDAETGYSLFTLGSKLKTLGDFEVNFGIMPFKDVSKNNNLIVYASAVHPLIAIDAQYEMQSSTTANALNYFKDPLQTDIIIGAASGIGPITIKGNASLSSYLEGGIKDTKAESITDKIAAEILLGMKDYFDTYSVELGYSRRGAFAEILAASDNDVLGKADTHRVYVKGFGQIGYWVTAKLEAGVLLPLELRTTSNIVISGKPGVALDFSIPANRLLKADIYGKVSYDTKPAASADALNFTEAGAKVSIGGVVPGVIENLDLYYGLKDPLGEVVFNTLVAEAALPAGVTGQLGFGLRSGDAVNNPFGVSLGANWTIPAPEAKSPSIYAQMVYNMDPYESDKYTLELDGYTTKGGQAKSDGLSAIRFGVKWSF